MADGQTEFRHIKMRIGRGDLTLIQETKISEVLDISTSLIFYHTTTLTPPNFFAQELAQRQVFIPTRRQIWSLIPKMSQKQRLITSQEPLV